MSCGKETNAVVNGKPVSARSNLGETAALGVTVHDRAGGPAIKAGKRWNNRGNIVQ